MYFVDAQDTRRYEMICGPQFLALFLKQPLYRRDRDIIPPCDLSKGHVATCEDLTEDWRGREIGYVLAKDCWGQGLMLEAVRAVIAECFGAQDYDFLTCGHFLRNRQSRRVIEKCGFSYWKDILFRTRMGTEEPTRLYLLKNTKKGDIHV